MHAQNAGLFSRSRAMHEARAENRLESGLFEGIGGALSSVREVALIYPEGDVRPGDRMIPSRRKPAEPLRIAEVARAG